MDIQLPLFEPDHVRAESIKALDELFANAKTIRQSPAFFEFMLFISRFTRYSPYNAGLLYIQNPKATFFVATPKQWHTRHHRTLKPGARPLLILAPMHPVMFVYDLADTEGPPLPQALIEPFGTAGEISKKVCDRTMVAALQDGILVQFRADYSPLQAGAAGRLPETETYEV